MHVFLQAHAILTISMGRFFPLFNNHQFFHPDFVIFHYCFLLIRFSLVKLYFFFLQLIFIVFQVESSISKYFSFIASHFHEVACRPCQMHFQMEFEFERILNGITKTSIDVRFPSLDMKEIG